MSERPTPETDAFMRGDFVANDSLWADFARKLERECDEFRERADSNVNALLSCLANLADHRDENLTVGMRQEIETAISMLNPPVNFDDWKNNYTHKP